MPSGNPAPSNPVIPSRAGVGVEHQRIVSDGAPYRHGGGEGSKNISRSCQKLIAACGSEIGAAVSCVLSLESKPVKLARTENRGGDGNLVPFVKDRRLGRGLGQKGGGSGGGA